MEADRKHNDTDPCWGPLRRVDAYRIYLVSGLASTPAQPGWPGAFGLGSLIGEAPQLHALASCWGRGPGPKPRHVTETIAVRPVTRRLGLAFRSWPAAGCELL